MPICDGMEATKKIRSYEQEIGCRDPVPIVGVSANARDESSKRALSAGMNDYLTKPYTKADVIGIVGKWVGKCRQP